MVLLLLTVVAAALACNPLLSPGREKTTTVISMDMEIQPPASWTLAEDDVNALQALDAKTLLDRIKNDVQHAASLIVAEYNFAKDQMVCNAHPQDFLQGLLVTGDCNEKMGDVEQQLIEADGTVGAVCVKNGDSWTKIPAVMHISVTCTTLAPATLSIWDVFVTKFQGRLEAKGVVFNKELTVVDATAPIATVQLQMDVRPPNSWTVGLTAGQAATPQAASDRVTNDFKSSVIDALTAVGSPTNDVTCAPIIPQANILQGELVTGDCSGNGQLLSDSGTVTDTCTLTGAPAQLLIRGKRRAVQRRPAIRAKSRQVIRSETDLPPLTCLFVMDYEYLGNDDTIDDGNFTNQKEFILNLAQTLFDSSDFAVIPAYFGYINDSVIPNEVPYKKASQADFNNSIDNDYIFSAANNVSYCQAITKFGAYFDSNLANLPGNKCLVLLTGQNYACTPGGGTRKKRGVDSDTESLADRFNFTVGVNIVDNGMTKSPLEGITSKDLIIQNLDSAVVAEKMIAVLEATTIAPTTTASTTISTTSSAFTPSTSPSTTTPSPFKTAAASMTFTASCTSLSPRTQEQWQKFDESLQTSLEGKKAVFNRMISF